VSSAEDREEQLRYAPDCSFCHDEAPHCDCCGACGGRYDLDADNLCDDCVAFDGVVSP